ncbi:hypothetical protein Vafri_8499 [Volvox africanus]|nr:hypothetical protein Vafri_8499 [Volvox africanus]
MAMTTRSFTCQRSRYDTFTTAIFVALCPSPFSVDWSQLSPPWHHVDTRFHALPAHVSHFSAVPVQPCPQPLTPPGSPARPPGILQRLLAHLDPELPIAISDNLWFRARHPNLFAPRCLPCHIAVDADPPTQLPPSSREESSNSKTSPHPQPKTLHIPNITGVMNGYLQFMLGVRSAADMESAKVQKLLAKNTFGDFNKSLTAISHLPSNASVPGVRYLPRPACPFCTARAACTPRPPKDHNVTGAGCFASGGHGGAGMIFSVGLLRRLSPERMKQCFMKIILAPGGDGMLSACLWEAGYAFTDPGASTLARYDGNYLLFSSEAGKWMLHDPLTVLLRGKCDGRCKWLLRNAASHHGRGRHFQNFEQSAAYLYANIASYTATHKWMAFMAGRDEDLAELQKLAATGNSS